MPAKHPKQWMGCLAALWPLLSPAQPATVLGSQLAPSGYLGAINTPVAKVLAHGALAASYSNSIPETGNPFPGEGHFGSITAGLGLLPGLEAFGRLSFGGDVWCNMYQPECRGITRDLSVSGKYQLPWVLPGNTRLAGGLTDYGGAATNYRSTYLVGTSDFGAVDVSLGYAHKISANALLDGVFASTVVRLTERLSAQLEYDTHQYRAGLAYVHALSGDVDLSLAASHKIGTDATTQQSGQLSMALVLHTHRARNQALKQYPPPLAAPEAPPLVSAAAPPYLPPATSAPAPDAPPSTPTQVAPAPGLHAADSDAGARAPLPTPLSTNQAAPATSALAQALADAGFGHISVRTGADAQGLPLLALQLEPVAWRQSRLTALGQALKTWAAFAVAQARQPAPELPPELSLTLTLRGQPVLSVRTSLECALAFRNGFDSCAAGPAIRFVPAPDFAKTSIATDTASATVPVTASQWLRPQFELGLGLRSTVGTEYGLADYATSLELGAELPLAPGLWLQGLASTPLANSGSFDEGRIFGDQRYKKTRMEQAFLSYWAPLGPFAAQASLGALNPTDQGGQIDVAWLSDNGRWRLYGMRGSYQQTDEAGNTKPEPLRSAIGALRYSVLPAQWHLDLTAGRFHNQDEGWRVSSVHFFGDNMFKLFMRRSGNIDTANMPQTSFAGFEVSFPLGPQRATTLGPITVRGRDRWRTGLETKVGESDNYLTNGYGFVPEVRHGLNTDGTDYDRAGLADLWADRDRLRFAMR